MQRFENLQGVVQIAARGALQGSVGSAFLEKFAELPAFSALINGAASHAVEFDDIWRNAVYHPGAPVIAAALATGQAHGANGEAFLRGVIVGYEISTRIGEAVMPSHYKYWHTTGTVGCFGAAASAGMLAGCNRGQFMDALGTVGTFAAGLRTPVLLDAIDRLEPLTPIVAFRRTANRRRRYEALANVPAGFLVVADAAYLLSTWHADTRPATLDLADAAATRWLGLEVKRHVQHDAAHALVEFVARYRIGGHPAVRLHEVSRFVREDGRWYYLDGEFPAR